jgi:hypothetical protein
MHEDHEVSRRARRKDTLSAEDLGILLKYDTSIFVHERLQVEIGLAMLFSVFTGSRDSRSRFQQSFGAARFWCQYRNSSACIGCRL